MSRTAEDSPPTYTALTTAQNPFVRGGDTTMSTITTKDGVTIFKRKIHCSDLSDARR
jgi:hypothetical protein